MSDRLETVRKSYRAYETRDRELIESVIAENGFVFSAPPDVGIDRDTYFERCWPNATLDTVEFVRLCEIGEDEVLATYEATRQDGTKFRNTEIFGVAGDRIKSVEVYFGWDL